MSLFKTCPDCGAALDPGERCDCQDTEDDSAQCSEGGEKWLQETVLPTTQRQQYRYTSRKGMYAATYAR